MRVFAGLDEFAAAKGEHLGYSDWHTISQDEIDQFAEATHDFQWIHVDPERAAQTPFGGTIAHGFLTLSLVPMLGYQIYQVEGVTMGINYGCNKVRFPSPVPVNSRVRAGALLTEVTDVPDGKQAVIQYTVEIEGVTKPACVAETVVRLLA